MNDTKSNKFMAIFSIPAAVMAEWKNTAPEAREAAENKMKREWQEWTDTHAKMINLTASCGSTKRITSSGITNTKNDICMYSIVDADSHEAAAKTFEKHPHLQIPQASIEVMPVRKI